MSILTSLISYWDLSESSGTRADSAGANTLTDNNTVTGAAGPGSHNASLFTLANSESLSHTSNASLIMGNIDFTFTFWFYLGVNNVQQEILSKDIYTPGSSRDYGVMANSNVLLFYTSGAANAQTVNIDSSLAVTTWYFGCAWNDSAAQKLNGSLNDGTTTVGGTYSSVPSTSTSSDFYIGRLVDATDQKYFGGRIAMVGIWKRLLTAAERTTLYNSGSGLSYAELVATVPADRTADPAARYRSLFMTL